MRLDSVSPAAFDTVYYVGGHGPMWDLAEDPTSIRLIESFLAADKPVALVCHAPAALRHVKTPEGRPLVEGKKVTGFANSEEEAVGLTEVVPFLLEDLLTEKGGRYSKTGDHATLRRRRRSAHHGTEPGVLRPCGGLPLGAARGGEKALIRRSEMESGARHRAG